MFLSPRNMSCHPGLCPIRVSRSVYIYRRLKTLFSTVPRGTEVTKQIIIGTPGTVLDWCFKRKLIDLTKIRVFVLDEADVMIDTQGFSDQSIRIQRFGPLVPIAFPA